MWMSPLPVDGGWIDGCSGEWMGRLCGWMEIDMNGRTIWWHVYCDINKPIACLVDLQSPNAIRLKICLSITIFFSFTYSPMSSHFLEFSACVISSPRLVLSSLPSPLCRELHFTPEWLNSPHRNGDSNACSIAALNNLEQQSEYPTRVSDRYGQTSQTLDLFLPLTLFGAAA